MVTVEVVGEGTREVDLGDVEPGASAGTAESSGSAGSTEPTGTSGSTGADREEPTYADLCRAVGYSPHEVAVMVDGRPVPDDQPVTAKRVKLLRLVQGG